MGAPTRNGGRPAPIDRPIIEFLQMSLDRVQQVERATISDDSGHFELSVLFGSLYYPAPIDNTTLSIQWYTNDDFKIHYRVVHLDRAWECRWDRHPNPHNTRDHFHPSPTAPTPGDDASWPADYRDVLTLVLDEVEQRITALWDE